MFRFLRITLILWLLSVALIGGAALYGRAHAAPNELQALGFDVCEGRPCFWGITPGVTPMDQAYSILKKHGEPQRLENHRILLGTPEKGITLVPSQKNENLVAVVGVSDTNLPSVNRFLLRFGTPCITVFDSTQRNIYIYYPNIFLRLDYYPSFPDHLDSGVPVDFVALVDVAHIADFPNYCEYIQQTRTEFPFADIVAPWSGFASYTYYQSHTFK